MSQEFRTKDHTYEVLRVIRERAGGATLEVRRKGDEQLFVLKRLQISELGDWKRFDLFEREIATLKSIEHPNVPRFIESHVDADAGYFFLVQERVEGETLKQIIDAQGSSPADRVEKWFRQCLEVLNYLHTCSPPIIHRDLSPSNIMIENDRAVLIDFGAVKIGNRDSTSMTTIGTFGYMPPEQMLGRAEPRSDLYSLAMTFISLATGLEPSEFPQNRNTGQVDVSSILTLPRHLKHVLMTMIRPGVEQRPNTVDEILSFLDKGPEAVAIAKRPRSSVPTRFSQSVSPYLPGTLNALSEADREYLMKHSLQRFPIPLLVFLHFITFGLFSLIHHGIQHGRLPQAVGNDPSDGKAIGFSFIPYFNMYWCVFSPMRLADRLNLQYRLRGKKKKVSKSLIGTCGVLGVIPYINFILGIPLWTIGMVKFQQAINELADEAEAEREKLEESSAFPMNQ